jgi:uncharacterized membrane protein
MQAELVLLRLVHVLGGLFWAGSGLFMTLFLLPALGSAGPAAGQVMAGLQQRRLFTVLPVVALLTLASGLRLMWITSAGFEPAYFATPIGRTFAVSGGLAIVAAILGLLVARPAAARAARVGATLAAAPDETTRAGLAAEMAALRRRSALTSALATAFLFLSAAGMAVARYVG